MPWGCFLEESRAAAAGLQARGVGPGSHVALLGPTTRPLATAIEAVWLCGATLIVLPLPMRLGSIEEFATQTRSRTASADVSLLLVDPDLAPFLEAQPDDPPTMLLSDLLPGPAARRRPTSTDRATTPMPSPSSSTRRGARPSPRASCSRTGRSAPTSTGSPPPPGSTSTTTCWCRGCRCTTTWAWSACSCCRHRQPPTSCSAPPRTSSPAHCGGWSGCRATAGRRRRVRTSPGCWPRGPCAPPRGSTCHGCGSR